MITTIIDIKPHENITVEMLCKELIKMCNKGQGSYKVAYPEDGASHLAKKALANNADNELILV